jgi:hypothetical protein
MARSNQSPADFREGDRVRVIDSCTAPGLLGKIGTVGKPNAKYQYRVTVRFYLDRNFREVFFHPSELEIVEE